jgi:hypothetical protein
VASEREKEIADFEHVTESFVWDVSSQPASSKYDVIMTSSVVCNSVEAIKNILDSLKTEGFLILLSFDGDKLETGEIVENVASRECPFATLSLMRNMRQQVIIYRISNCEMI